MVEQKKGGRRTAKVSEEAVPVELWFRRCHSESVDCIKSVCRVGGSWVRRTPGIRVGAARKQLSYENCLSPNTFKFDCCRVVAGGGGLPDGFRGPLR
mgnify:CR=1 FL=1